MTCLTEIQYKAARRILSKRSAGIDWPEIIRSTRITSSDRPSVLSAVDAHLAGRFPLPAPAGTYLLKDWRRGMLWIRQNDRYLGLLENAKTWDNRMRARLGHAYDDIFGTESAGKIRTASGYAADLGHPWEFEFVQDNRTAPRTPAALTDPSTKPPSAARFGIKSTLMGFAQRTIPINRWVNS